MPNLSHLTPPSLGAFRGRWVGIMLRLGIVGLTTWPVGMQAEFFELGFFERQVAARAVG